MAIDKNGKPLPKGITLRPDGRYQGRFTYGGERYTLYGFNLKELQKQMQDMQYELEHGIYAKKEKISVNAWFETWIEEYKANSVKFGTLKSYQECFRNYIAPALGKRQLSDMRPEHIQKLFNDMIRKGYSRSTIGLTSVVLKGMFNQAVKNKIIRENPAALTTLPRERQKEEPRVMSREEQTLFLQYAKTSRYYDLYKLALFTGMRAGELRALQWSDVDFKKSVIHVNGTLKYEKGNGYFRDSPKTATSQRDIPMLEGVSSLLKNRRKCQLEQRLLLGERWEEAEGLEGLVFANEFGQPVSHDSLNVDIRKIVKRIKEEKSDFKHLTPHSLRHTFATRCIESGMEPNVLQKILGHSSLAMTMDLYAHVLPDTKADQLEKIANLF